MSSNISKIILLLTVIGIIVSKEHATKECQKRYYGEDHIVCVCNSVYCDTIPPITKIDSGKFLVYTSNKAGLRFKKTEELVEPIYTTTTNSITIGEKIYQKIDGFGGAFTDAVGININSLNKDAKQSLLESYFGTNGIEYTLGRVPMGCSDFSTHCYTYDDTPYEDTELTTFKLAPEDILYKIPIIQEAKRLSNNKLKLIGTAWTSPKWMKVIPQYVTLFSELKKEMYQPWAEYQIKFIEAYDEYNLTMWAISTGNEPSIGYIPAPIPTVAFTAPLLSQWIANNLGPTLRASKYSNVKILVLDDERLFLPTFIDEMFKNPATREYSDGIALHWYFDKWAPVSALDDTHHSYPEKFLIVTEACRGQIPLEKKVDLGSWDRAEDNAFGIIENFNHWSTGWVDWNMALDVLGGPSYVGNNVDSPIIVNATAGEFYKQPMFYALGHFSKFVPPGSVRIDLSQDGTDIQVIGFKRPDGGTAIVILNKSDDEEQVTVVDKDKGQLPLHLTAHSLTSLVFW